MNAMSWLFSLKYNETPVNAISNNPDSDILVLHALVHVQFLDLGLVPAVGDIVVAAGNTAVVVQSREAETSNHHLEQRLMPQATYYTAFAADLRSFVLAAEERSIRHLEQTQTLRMARTTAAFAEGTVAEIDSFGAFHQ
jgi:hypothetical protein